MVPVRRVSDDALLQRFSRQHRFQSRIDGDQGPLASSESSKRPSRHSSKTSRRAGGGSRTHLSHHSDVYYGSLRGVLQPVAWSDRPSVDKPTPASFGPRQTQTHSRQRYKLDQLRALVPAS